MVVRRLLAMAMVVEEELTRVGEEKLCDSLGLEK
jgi:hypothetical protein